MFEKIQGYCCAVTDAQWWKLAEIAAPWAMVNISSRRSGKEGTVGYASIIDRGGAQLRLTEDVGTVAHLSPVGFDEFRNMIEGEGDSVQAGPVKLQSKAMPDRAMIAAMAMEGIVARSGAAGVDDMYMDRRHGRVNHYAIVSDAVQLADALIAELSKGK